MQNKYVRIKYIKKSSYKWYTLTDDINNHSNVHTHTHVKSKIERNYKKIKNDHTHQML